MSDLQAYLDRIGYAGPRTPTLDTLRAIHACHPTAIPFENLDVLLGKPVLLAPEALLDKLVRAGRGGYCYEHNLLLCAMLRELGFAVRPLLARVQWGVPEHELRGRTHMLLQVTVGGSHYFVDVGFGGLTHTGPVRADIGVAQQTPHERARVIQLRHELPPQWQLQAELQGQWRPLYRFDLQEQEPVDYELANHWTATHPSSRFRRQLVVARPAEGCRHVLVDAEYTLHRLDGPSIRKRFTDATELRQLLHATFRIELPRAPELTELLTRIVSEQPVHASSVA